MTEHKKIKKIFSIVAIIIAVMAIVAATVIGLFLYYVKSTREYCNNYANEQSKTSTLPEEKRYPEFNDQCLKDRGFGSF